VARLKRAEADLWQRARLALSDEQLETLRSLIEAWINENRERTVVSLIRFDDFVDERKFSSGVFRGKAHGLLSEVSEASAAVEDARLLGERLLWFAGRYPYLLGEQAELTAYRIIDQPEFAQISETAKSAQRLSDTLASRVESLQNDMEQQQAALFTKLAVERKAAIDQFYDRLAQERKLLLDDISSRQGELLGIMGELRQTIAASGALANELTGTVNAIDKVVSHFDTESEGKNEPLRMSDERDAATETGKAADRVTHLLERAIELLESKSWDRTISTLTNPADELIDRVFWRGVVLICLLLTGLALLRFIPQRMVGKMDDKLSQ
jgi:hypothetical protein